MRKAIAGLLLGLAVAPAMAQEAVKAVVIPAAVAYTNKDVIDSAIVAECNLPQKASDLLMQKLGKAGIEGKAVDQPKSDSGDNVLLLEIASAQSGGSAFVGHFKGVTVTGKLFQKGKQVGSFVATRKSSGGAFGGFKGSCAVLGRCVDTITKDITGWLGSPVDGAKLGDAR
ncbi:MAG: hypothetical protein ACT4PK_09570 [Gammaproteobacteria bacterium]